MSIQDKKHRSHLPMRNTAPAGNITYDAKDPDQKTVPYGPTEAYFDKTWKLEDIVTVRQ